MSPKAHLTSRTPSGHGRFTLAAAIRRNRSARPLAWPTGQGHSAVRRGNSGAAVPEPRRPPARHRTQQAHRRCQNHRERSIAGASGPSARWPPVRQARVLSQADLVLTWCRRPSACRARSAARRRRGPRWRARPGRSPPPPGPLQAQLAQVDCRPARCASGSTARRERTSGFGAPSGGDVGHEHG